MIFTGEDWLNRCENVLEMFEKLVPTYYTYTDVQAGGIHAEGRSGEKCFFPMTSLSVGLVAPGTTQYCQSHVELADLASEAKKLAKKIEGNSYFVNHRKSPKILDVLSKPYSEIIEFHVNT